jgi:hypothetical protein
VGSAKRSRWKQQEREALSWKRGGAGGAPVEAAGSGQEGGAPMQWKPQGEAAGILPPLQHCGGVLTRGHCKEYQFLKKDKYHILLTYNKGSYLVRYPHGLNMVNVHHSSACRWESMAAA